MQLLYLLLSFYFNISASEDCQATSNTETTGLLQIVGTKNFCQDFYEEKDWETVSQGLQAAKSTFMEYCTSSGSRDIDCEALAEEVFSNSEGLDEELCDKLMEAVAENYAISGVHGSSQLLQAHEASDSDSNSTFFRRRRRSIPTRTETSPGRSITGNRISEVYYDDFADTVRIAAIRYRRRWSVITNGYRVYGDSNECVEMGSSSNSWQAFVDLEHFLNRIRFHSRDERISEERHLAFGTACGPYYNAFERSQTHYNVERGVERGYRVAVFRHTADYNREDFRNRFNPSQGREEEESKIVIARYRQDGESRCAEMGVAPDDDRAFDLFSEWLEGHLEEGGATEVVSQLGQRRGVVCGPTYSRFYESYFYRTPNILGSMFYRSTTGAHIVVWRSG